MKSIGCRFQWPKLIYIEVRDGDCNLLDGTFEYINSWDEVIPLGTAFAQDVMAAEPANENLDEVYWNYIVVEEV